jgi:hypothetical protein
MQYPHHFLSNYQINRLQNWDFVCNMSYDTGKYVRAGSHTPRYFYNKAVGNCQLFTYYGALGNANKCASNKLIK